MDEIRFQRLEDKVDNVKEEVTEIKTDIRIHMSKIEEHVAGDNKIITHLAPLLEKLPTIIQVVEDYTFEKRTKEERNKKLTGVVKISAGITAVTTAIVSVAKLLEWF